MIENDEIQIGDIVTWKGVNRELYGVVTELAPRIMLTLPSGEKFSFSDVERSMSLKVTRNADF